MKRRGSVTAFYIETLVMITVMIGILLVLTQIFGAAKRESIRAKRLTEAVLLAQNAAEALAAGGTPEAVRDILGLENAAVTEEDGQIICRGTASWIRKGERGGFFGRGPEEERTVYEVELVRIPAESLWEDEIRILLPDGETPLYTLPVKNRRGDGEEGTS